MYFARCLPCMYLKRQPIDERCSRRVLSHRAVDPKKLRKVNLLRQLRMLALEIKLQRSHCVSPFRFEVARLIPHGRAFQFTGTHAALANGGVCLQ